MTIHGWKWTPRASPMARITSGTTADGRSAEVSTFDPWTTAWMLMGGGLGHGRPHGPKLCQGCPCRRHPRGGGARRHPPGLPHLGRRRPGVWTAGVQRRTICVRELSCLPLVIVRETLRDKLQHMPRRSTVHNLRVSHV